MVFSFFLPRLRGGKETKELSLSIDCAAPSCSNHVFAPRCESANLIGTKTGWAVTILTNYQTNLTPPPGITPNFVDPQTLAPTILAVSVVMMIWVLLFVIIRLYANFHAPRGLGIDDCKTCSIQSSIHNVYGLRLLPHCHSASFHILGHLYIM